MVNKFGYNSSIGSGAFETIWETGDDYPWQTAQATLDVVSDNANDDVVGTAGRTLLASSSGALVDWLNGDWGIFFILTAIMVIPSLICLWFIKDKLKIHEK